MPELPEVETVRRGLAPVLEGHRIARAEEDWLAASEAYETAKAEAGG